MKRIENFKIYDKIKLEKGMKQEIIKVFDITKNLAIDASVGNIIYNKIKDALRDNEKIILDFDKVDIILSVFLNAAIGSFYCDDFCEDFENKVSAINISDSAKILWDRVVQSAKRKKETN